jgi:PEGA domain
MTARLAWLAAIVPLWAAMARAQPPGEPPGEAIDEASDHLARGVAAYQARHFPQAVDELLQANRLAPDRPEPYRWLALAEAEIDDCPSALINIDAYVSRAPPDDPGTAELAALRDRCLGAGKVDVDSTPSGATIRVDGGPPLGATPIKHLAMRVGPHTLTLEKQGFDRLSRRIEVRPLGVEYASFTLTPARPPQSRQWVTWVALGAAAVVGLGIVISHDSNDSPPMHTAPPSLPGVTCTSAGCHP